jgi:hypothetical protein
MAAMKTEHRAVMDRYGLWSNVLEMASVFMRRTLRIETSYVR